MSRIAIVAAMPGELTTLVNGWKHEPQNGVNLWRKRFGDAEWIAVCAGAGQDRAARAFAAAERCGRIDKALSIGWAGALNEESHPGEVYRVSGVIDVRTGERFETAEMGRIDSQIWLATAPKVADEQEKQRLRSAYGAALVDMEAAAVARLARMRKIPFYCIKGVSDGYKDRLPDFNRFMTKAGQFQLAKFIVFTLLRPHSWPMLIRMGENSKKAAVRMAESVRDILG
jgi:adenosylhomocysteine nucleosidase